MDGDSGEGQNLNWTSLSKLYGSADRLQDLKEKEGRFFRAGKNRKPQPAQPRFGNCLVFPRQGSAPELRCDGSGLLDLRRLPD
jgi:hypothetical protein